MLLTIFSTLSQPLFEDPLDLIDNTDGTSLAIGRTETDSEPLSDTNVFDQTKTLSDSSGTTDANSVDQSQTFSDSEGLSDTSTASFVFFRDIDDSENLSDTSVTDFTFGRTLEEFENLAESVALDLTSVRSDNLGPSDATALNQSKNFSDNVSASDTVSLQRFISLTENEVISDTVTATRNMFVTFTEGEPQNVIRFGSGPGFGTFVFGTGSALVSDTVVAVREFEFTDDGPMRDSIRTARVVPAIRITVHEAELRWDIE